MRLRGTTDAWHKEIDVSFVAYRWIHSDLQLKRLSTPRQIRDLYFTTLVFFLLFFWVNRNVKEEWADTRKERPCRLFLSQSVACLDLHMYISDPWTHCEVKRLLLPSKKCRKSSKTPWKNWSAATFINMRKSIDGQRILSIKYWLCWPIRENRSNTSFKQWVVQDDSRVWIRSW